MIKNIMSKVRSHKDKIVNGIVNGIHYFGTISVGCGIALLIEYGICGEIIFEILLALTLAICTKVKLIEDKQINETE